MFDDKVPKIGSLHLDKFGNRATGAVCELPQLAEWLLVALCLLVQERGQIRPIVR